MTPESVDVVLDVVLFGQVDGVRCHKDQVAGFDARGSCSGEVGRVTAECDGVAGIEGVGFDSAKPSAREGCGEGALVERCVVEARAPQRCRCCRREASTLASRHSKRGERCLWNSPLQV